MALYDTVKQEIQYFLGHITQAYSYNGGTPVTGETGIDVGLPTGTPIYATAPGTILGTGYYGGGGVVSEKIANTVSEYYQHLDQVVATVGEQVGAGTLIGYSGGQLSGGHHPSSPAFSSGPHLEIGFNAPYGGMWDPLGNSFNPVPLLTQQENGTGTGLSMLSNPNGSSNSSDPCGPMPNPKDFPGGINDPSFVSAMNQWGICKVNNVGPQQIIGNALSGIWSGLAQFIAAPFAALGITSFADFMWRMLFIGLAIVLLIIGVKAFTINAGEH